MPQCAATPPLAPGRDGTVFLVLDSQADLQTVVADLLFGQYRHPRRVVAFNTANGWMRDISADIAGEALSCGLETDSAPPVRDFLARACR